MTEALDRLDLELRTLPGVVAVGVAEAEGSRVVQVVVSGEYASSEVRDQIRRLTLAVVQRPLVLEVLVSGGAVDDDADT